MAARTWSAWPWRCRRVPLRSWCSRWDRCSRPAGWRASSWIAWSPRPRTTSSWPRPTRRCASTCVARSWSTAFRSRTAPTAAPTRPLCSASCARSTPSPPTASRATGSRDCSPRRCWRRWCRVTCGSRQAGWRRWFGRRCPRRTTPAPGKARCSHTHAETRRARSCATCSVSATACALCRSAVRCPATSTRSASSSWRSGCPRARAGSVMDTCPCRATTRARRAPTSTPRCASSSDFVWSSPRRRAGCSSPIGAGRDGRWRPCCSRRGASPCCTPTARAAASSPCAHTTPSRRDRSACSSSPEPGRRPCGVRPPMRCYTTRR